MILPLFIFLGVVGLNVIVSVYLERKVSAFIQDRVGPMEVGKWGLLQLFADLIKLLQKEDVISNSADRKLFKVAPYLIFAAVFVGFAFIPISKNLQAANVQTGVFLLIGLISLDILGILMAGWSSNNKYSLLGAMRSAAQIISYEIPMGISILCVCMISTSLNFQDIISQQGIFSAEPNFLFGIKALGIETNHIGGVLTWNIFRSPLLIPVFIIFFISALAEANRAPFDLPEAESELIAGFQTEYSGFRWAILFLAEYGMMLLLSLLGVILFFGGWNTPFPNLGTIKLAEWTSGYGESIGSDLWGGFWMFSKAYFLMLIQMWVRWSFPRVRVDQLMYLCWKVLTPIGLLLLLFCALWRILMIV